MNQNPISNSKKLGRGLSSLLGERPVVYQNKQINVLLEEKNIKEIPLEQIKVNPSQPRKYFKEKELLDLKNSIEAHGLLQPILVKQIQENEYDLISGERRLRACRMIGYKTILAVIKQPTSKETLIMAIVENVQREDLNPIEEAFGYKRLFEEFKYTQEEIGDKVGKSRSHITNIMRLLGLSEEVQNMINKGLISEGHARALINHEADVELAQIIVERRLSVREAEKLAKDTKENKKSICKTKTNTKVEPIGDTYLKNIGNVFKTTCGLSTKATYNSRVGKGKIVIDYKNKQDLEQIINKLI